MGFGGIGDYASAGDVFVAPGSTIGAKITPGGEKALNEAGGKLGFNTDKERAASQEEKDAIERQQAANKTLLQKAKEAGKSYFDSYDTGVAKYQNQRGAIGQNIDQAQGTFGAQQEQLRQQAQLQAQDARQTYSNTIQPRLIGSMEDAYNNSKNAMTLQEAGDVNNKIATDTRALYEKQAQGENRQGLSSAGVLSSLGAQALGNQLGGGIPMTGGQMQALAGQNMSQAGQAYANTQRRIQSLRDQGLQMGFERSDKQYERGQGALDRYRQSIGDISGAENNYLQQQAALRGEQGLYGNNILANQLAQTDRQQGYNKEDLESTLGRANFAYQDTAGTNALEQGQSDQYYQGQRQIAALQQQQAFQNNMAKQGIYGQIAVAGAQTAGKAAMV